MVAALSRKSPGERVDIAERLARERRARLAAERILDQKKRELYAANQQLAQHARALSVQIAEQRHGLEEARTEAEVLKGQNVRALSDLERATEVATLAQRRLWAALETFRDGFAIFDREMKLVLANRAYLQVFPARAAIASGTGYDRILKVAATSGLVDLEGADPQDWYHEMTARILGDRIEPKVIRFASGRHVRLIDRRAEDGDLVSLVLDITESVRREAELDEARARAEAATRAKSAFLANMTHELRTPMNGVVGMAELLVESPLSDEQRLYAETIRSSGEALLTIINDILDYSKAEAQRLRINPEPFDLELCVHDVMRIAGQPALEKRLALIVDYEPGLPQCFVGDPGRIRQVLTNLVGNAVKFTPAGHVVVRVTGLPAPPSGWRLQITVEDTGIGIAAEHADHIFGEFNQVQDKPNRRFEGTGLGLAITRQLVELMGGSVWVESQLGQGACFGIDLELPAAPAGEDADLASVAGLSVWLAMAQGVGRDVLQRAVVAGCASVRCFADADALREATGPWPDAIVWDAAMWEERTGVSAASSAASILVLSGPDLPADAEKAEATLRQPVSRRELFQILAGSRARTDVPVAKTSPESGPRQMRVLAAEDNRTNQLVFRKMVKDFDIDLAIAQDGREAVELWRSFRPDLIFMDISMPGMDGREATREIRRIEASGGGGRVPIIALTAHAMPGDEESILAAGIDRYLTKPLRRNAIATAIAEHCPAPARPPLPAAFAAGAAEHAAGIEPAG